MQGIQSLKPYVQENTKQNIEIKDKLAYIMSGKTEKFDISDDRLDAIKSKAPPEMLKIADCVAELF